MARVCWPAAWDPIERAQRAHAFALGKPWHLPARACTLCHASDVCRLAPPCAALQIGGVRTRSSSRLAPHRSAATPRPMASRGRSLSSSNLLCSRFLAPPIAPARRTHRTAVFCDACPACPGADAPLMPWHDSRCRVCGAVAKCVWIRRVLDVCGTVLCVVLRRVAGDSGGERSAG